MGIAASKLATLWRKLKQRTQTKNAERRPELLEGLSSHKSARRLTVAPTNGMASISSHSELDLDNVSLRMNEEWYKEVENINMQSLQSCSECVVKTSSIAHETQLMAKRGRNMGKRRPMGS